MIIIKCVLCMVLFFLNKREKETLILFINILEIQIDIAEK